MANSTIALNAKPNKSNKFATVKFEIFNQNGKTEPTDFILVNYMQDTALVDFPSHDENEFLLELDNLRGRHTITLLKPNKKLNCSQQMTKQLVQGVVSDMLSALGYTFLIARTEV